MDSSEGQSESSVELVRKAEYSLLQVSAETNRISLLNFRLSGVSDQ